MRFLVLISLIGTCIALPSDIAQFENDCVLFCYYTPSDSTPRDAKLLPKNLPNPQPCTHLVYGFANVNMNHHVVPMSESDVPTLSEPGRYYDVNRKNPGVQTLLAIHPSAVGPHQSRRGDLQDLDQPLEFLANDYTRKTFIASARDYLREHDFDGMVIHLDQPERAKWEFVELLKEFKPMLEQESVISKKPRLSIVFAMSASQLETCKDLLPRISKCVDYIYLATYDNAIARNQFKTSYLNPLNTESVETVNQTLTHITRKAITNGISPEKLVVGLSTLGRSYVLNQVDSSLAGAPALEWGYPGKYTNKRGQLAYYEICTEDGEENEDLDALAASKTLKSNQWVTYNPPTEVLRRKLRWIQNQGYAGVGLWTLDADDFNNFCRRGAYPLLETAATTLRCFPKRPPLGPLTDEGNDDNSFGGNGIPGQSNNFEDSPLGSGSQRGGWSVRLCYFRPERDNSDFDFLNLGDPNWCTHIVLSFLELKTDGTLSLSPALRLGHRMYQNWRPRPSQYKPALILGIGGFQGSQTWRPLLTSESKRNNLVKSIFEALETYEARGVDIHWTRDMSERKGMSLLVSNLKAKMTADLKFWKLIVSVTPSAAYNNLYDTEILARNADYIHLLGNLFHFPEERKTGHHAAFTARPGGFPSPRNTIRGLTSFWLGKSVPPKKLVIGMTAEALTQTLTREAALSAEIGLGMDATGPGHPMNRTRRAGVASYMEVWMALSKPFSRYRLLSEISVPVGVVEDLFIAYDNSDSVQLKTRWASLEKLAGVALWAVEYDDPWGLCPGGQKFPLLQKMYDSQIGDRCHHRGFKGKQRTSADQCSRSWRVQCEYKLPGSMNQTGQTVNPENLPWENCTHMIISGITAIDSVARVKTDNDKDALPDIAGMTATYLQRTIRMRQYGARSKLIASVRCGYTKSEFGNLIRSSEFRSRLIRNIFAFTQERQLDGVELDCDHLLTAEIKKDFLNLQNQLSATLKSSITQAGCPLSFSLRIPGWRLDLGEVYDVQALNGMVDTVSLEAYRYNSVQDAHVKHHSPLYSDYASGQVAIDATIHAWKDVETVNPSKIILVLPAFATTFKLRYTDSYDIGAPAEGPGQESVLTGELGKAASWEMCGFLNTNTLSREVSVEQIAAYAYGGSRWMAYETPETATFKLNYAVKLGLGGIGVYSLNEADNTGVCRLGPFPLVAALAEKCH